MKKKTMLLTILIAAAFLTLNGGIDYKFPDLQGDWTVRLYHVGQQSPFETHVYFLTDQAGGVVFEYDSDVGNYTQMQPSYPSYHDFDINIRNNWKMRGETTLFGTVITGTGVKYYPGGYIENIYVIMTKRD